MKKIVFILLVFLLSMPSALFVFAENSESLTHSYDLSNAGVVPNDEAINDFINQYKYVFPAVRSTAAGSRSVIIVGSHTNDFNVYFQSGYIHITNITAEWFFLDSKGVVTTKQPNETEKFNKYFFSTEFTSGIESSSTDIGGPNTAGIYYTYPAKTNYHFASRIPEEFLQNDQLEIVLYNDSSFQRIKTIEKNSGNFSDQDFFSLRHVYGFTLSDLNQYASEYFGELAEYSSLPSKTSRTYLFFNPNKDNSFTVKEYNYDSNTDQFHPTKEYTFESNKNFLMIEDYSTGSSSLKYVRAATFDVLYPAKEESGEFAFSLHEYEKLKISEEPGPDDHSSVQDEQIIVPIDGGLIESRITLKPFDPIVYDVTKGNASSSFGTLEVIDSRGSGEGWNTTISFSPFVLKGADDPTSSENKVDVQLETAILSIALSQPESLAGQGTENVNRISETIQLESNGTSETILTADPGYGMGAYQVDLSFDLDIGDGSVRVISDPDVSSSLSKDDVIGLITGDYTSTVTITTGSGL